MEEEICDLSKLDEVLNQEKIAGENIQDQLDGILALDCDDSDEDEDVESESESIDRLLEECSNVDEIKGLDLLSDNLHVNVNTIRPYIPATELKMILECEDKQLQTVLILNRYKLIQLKNLIVRTNALLSRCENREQEGDDPPRRRWGYPYFKTLIGTSCPPNADVLAKSANGQMWLDYALRNTKWTRSDLIDLKRGIVISYHKYEVRELENRLVQLEKARDSPVDQMALRTEIAEARKALAKKQREKCITIPALYSNFEVDWEHISKVELKEKHSAKTCQAVWQQFLHPTINKSRWEPNETARLERIAEQHGVQDWKSITAELGTNRTSYIAICKYTSLPKQTRRFTAKSFSHSENTKLLGAVRDTQIGDYIPWNMVQTQFPNRTKMQLYTHHQNVLMQDVTLQKGPFSKLEDIFLYCYCKLHGEKFKECEKELKTRNRTQLRSRYLNYLKREGNVQNGNWTLDEDKIILTRYQNSSSNFSAKALSKDMNRTDTAIRHRLDVIRNFLHKNPEKTLEDMIRRGHTNYDANNWYLENVRKLSEEFLQQNAALTPEAVKKFLYKAENRRGRPAGSAKRITFGLSNDRDLIDHFKTLTLLRKRPQVRVDDAQITKTAALVSKYLSALNVNLNAPPRASTGLLDDIDKRLLPKLPTTNAHQQLIAPPNTFSALALRTLLLKFLSYKSVFSNHERHQNSRHLLRYLDTLSDAKAAAYKQASDAFLARLRTLFVWPALLSLVQRDFSAWHQRREMGLHGEEQVEERKPVKQGASRKVGRPKKDLWKIQLMTEARRQRRLLMSSSPVAKEVSNFAFERLESAFQGTSARTYGNRKRKPEAASASDSGSASSPKRRKEVVEENEVSEMEAKEEIVDLKADVIDVKTDIVDLRQGDSVTL